MPELIWPNKRTPSPVPAGLQLYSITYPDGVGYPDGDAGNRLILGDNLAIMSALMADYEGKIDLIYADPPFFTNRHFQTRIGRGEDSRKPRDWQMAEGYPDAWPDIEAYLDMLYPRLVMMHRLLSPHGTLYLHLDWHANAYARVLLDEIFGSDRLLNEIIWAYHGPSPIRRAFNRKHDTILAYTKSAGYTFNVDAVRQPYDPNTVKTFASSSKAGFGKIPDLKRGKVPEDWWYFPVVARLHRERTGYPTQKPEALLERVLLASSNPGDLVADFFCGSGTLPIMASRLGRTFIASDATWRAVHTTRVRLIENHSNAFTHEHVTDHPWRVGSIDYPASLVGNRVIIDAHTAHSELDYWEVDPVWDGGTFRSAAQVIRPRRLSQIPLSLELPENSFGERVCLRLVGVNGQISQMEIKKDGPMSGLYKYPR